MASLCSRGRWSTSSDRQVGPTLLTWQPRIPSLPLVDAESPVGAAQGLEGCCAGWRNPPPESSSCTGCHPNPGATDRSSHRCCHGATQHACQLCHLASPRPPAVCSCLPRALIATPQTGWDSGSVKSLRRVTGSHTQVRSTYNNPSIQQAVKVSTHITLHVQFLLIPRGGVPRGAGQAGRGAGVLPALLPRHPGRGAATGAAECDLRWRAVSGPGLPVGVLRPHLGSPQPHPPRQPGSAQHSPHPLGPLAGTLHPAQVGPPPTCRPSWQAGRPALRWR